MSEKIKSEGAKTHKRSSTDEELEKPTTSYDDEPKNTRSHKAEKTSKKEKKRSNDKEDKPSPKKPAQGGEDTTTSGGSSKQGPAGIQLETLTEFPHISLAEQTLHVMCRLSVPPQTEQNKHKQKRAPVDLIAVVDISGSMAGKKISLVKEACSFVAEQLQEHDNFALVTFETRVNTVMSLTEMSNANKSTTKNKIQSIEVLGGTNLGGGLLEGIKQAKKGQNQVSSIWLFTDGLTNEGPYRTTHSIVSAMHGRLGTETKHTVFTFGFGADHNPSLLKAIADAGQGMYYFIEETKDIGVSFADCLGGVMSVVAQNISLTVTPLGDVKLVKVLGSTKQKSRTKTEQTHNRPADEDEDELFREKKKKKKEKTKKKTEKQQEENAKQEVSKASDTTPIASKEPATVSLGDIYSGEGRDVLCIVLVPKEKTATHLPLVDFKLSYFDVLEETKASAVAICNIARVDSVTEITRNMVIDTQINRLATAEAMQEAQLKAETNDLKAAKALLDATIAKIQKSISALDPLCVQLIADLKEIKGTMSDVSSYQTKGAKVISWKSEAHSHQRAVGKGGSSYATDKKKEMISKFEKESVKPKSKSKNSKKYDDCD